MSNSHKNIQITKNTNHEKNCKSSINNNILNKSLNLQINNININEMYNFQKYGDEINFQENESDQEINSYKDFNINNEMGNEDTFNNEGILISRNILSNYNSQEFIDEIDNYNIINNSVYYERINSYSRNSIIKDIDIDKNKIIEKLNISTIKDDLNNFLDDNCIICLEQYKKGDNYIILLCKHFFHENCIKKWIYRKNKCPICNSEIK